ncbi:MAG TPA: hypothetical protein PKJ56_00895 [Promineifilum sp.]|nr:hypothetical protein [Promineifilum sp.]
MPPWVVTGETPPERMTWYLRHRAYADEVARGQRDAQKHENRNG